MCRGGCPPHFSRSKVDQFFNRNLADENQALSEHVRRFIAHQNAVLLNPTILRKRFLLHETGHRFMRRLQSEPWMEMRLDMKNEDPKARRYDRYGSNGFGLMILDYRRKSLSKRG